MQPLSEILVREDMARAVEAMGEGVPTEIAQKVAAEIAESVAPKRRTHPWLHPTKGWRNFARPRGGKANRRRALIPCGALSVHTSNAYHRLHLSGGRWPKLRK